MKSKTDNTNKAAKIALRKAAINFVGEPCVFDAYAGEGHMYDKCYRQAKEYYGVDRKYQRPVNDPRGRCKRADNLSEIRNPQHRGRYNLVDLDAYDNPWPLLRPAISLLLPGRCAIIATCAQKRCSRVSKSLRNALGINFRNHANIPLIEKYYSEAICRILLRNLLPTVTIVKVFWKSQAFINYWLIELEVAQ